MGVVYKAKDTKLDRVVALKFLPAHLLGGEDIRKRFKREAKSTAALSHSNVCTVHEIDDVEGETFIAMDFLKGETLEARITKGPLPLKDALEIGRQVAEGLQAAHAESPDRQHRSWTDLGAIPDRVSTLQAEDLRCRRSPASLLPALAESEDEGPGASETDQCTQSRRTSGGR